jgi:hypothetical protein
MERFERKNKGNPQITPRFSKYVPLIRGDIDWWKKIDLDLISLFPQKDLRSMRGMERKGKLFKVNHEGK